MSGNNASGLVPAPCRVLHIVRNLSVGGMEGRVARLAHGLNPAQFQITILGLRPLEGRQVELPNRVPYLTEIIEPGLHLSALWRLAKHIRHGHYDVVHTHNWPTMFYGILAAKLAGVPVIFHGEHGLESAKNTPRKRLLAQRALATLCKKIVAVNASIGKVVKKEWSLGEEKVVVLPNGVDISRFQPPKPNSNPSENSLGTAGNIQDTGRFVIGTVGRHVAVKDLPCLLRGFAAFYQELARQKPGTKISTQLLLVGDGPLTEALKTLAHELGILSVSEFAGDAPKPESFYQRMTLYTNTSVYEGMSNTLLEAMASGLPLIASDVPGNRDWLTSENALFFKSGDDKALSQVFLQLYENNELRLRMAHSNHIRALAEFDNQQFLKRYAKLYSEVLSRPELALP